MSLDFDKIEKLIFEGAISAYIKNLNYSYQFTNYTTRMIEYIITVNVAEKLFSYVDIKNLKVHLEYPIRDFYNGAFPDFVWDKFGFKKGDYTPVDNPSGLVDIVITSDGEHGKYFRETPYSSIIGIEIKSINRTIPSIKKDIERMADAMVLKNKIDENNIKKGYVLFMRKLGSSNNLNSKEQLENKLEKDKKNWNNIISEYQNKYMKLLFEINSEEIFKTSNAEIVKEYPPEFFDYSDVADKTGVVISYLIKISRK